MIIGLFRQHPLLSCGSPVSYGQVIRKDPVKIRVAIPAADPPDNITHDLKERAA